MVFDTVEVLAGYFAQKLADMVQEKPGYTSVALSGGSTPRAIFELLSKDKNSLINWDKLRIFWGDERCVPPEDPESNYHMTRESLLLNVPVPPGNVFRIRGEHDPVQEATSYSSLVEDLIPLVDQTPVFDLVMLGLGEDGHTASVFPDNIDLFDSPSLYAASRNPYSGQERITATGRMINHARQVVFLVTGVSKADMVAKILLHREDNLNYPASRVQPVSRNLIWLLDASAASLLDPSSVY